MNALCYEPKPPDSPHKIITFKSRLSTVCGSIVAGLGFSEYAPTPKHINTPTPEEGGIFSPQIYANAGERLIGE